MGKEKSLLKILVEKTKKRQAVVAKAGILKSERVSRKKSR
jgi:hypothetical protein